MILIEQDDLSSINRPFYLTPTVAVPLYAISIIKKGTQNDLVYPLIDISTTDVFQLFSFSTIKVDLQAGSYDYKLYQVEVVGTINATSILLEVGLMEVIGEASCVADDIAYSKDEDDISYYICGT